jgi:hypothetical protein
MVSKEEGGDIMEYEQPEVNEGESPIAAFEC